MSTSETNQNGSTAQNSQSDSGNWIQLGDVEGQTTVPDISSSSSSSMDTPPAVPYHTTDNINRSPRLLPILKSSGDALSTGENHNNSTIQMSQSDLLQTGDLIELGGSSSSSPTDTPSAASGRTAEDDGNNSRILPSILDLNDDALSTIETYQNSSTIQISQSASLQSVWLTWETARN